MDRMIRKLALSLSVVVLVALGVIVFGRLANTDIQAIVLTTLFFGAFAVVLFLVIRRRRELLGWLAVPFVVTAGLAGVWLGLPLLTDSTVDEQVVTAPSVSSTANASQTQENRLVASGQFEAASHPGSGKASIVEKPDGAGVVTFTDFETDNGPDLNVYLVNGSTGDVSDYIDLGDLKGNVGEQNFEIPEGVDLSVYDTVWIWCVRFSSGFGSAELAAA